MRTLHVLLFFTGFSAVISANAGNKQLKDYFLPMEPQGPLVSEGIFGTPEVFPRDPLNGLEDSDVSDWVYWDGRIVKGHDGKYHLYASRWDQSMNHSDGWHFGSKAIHSVSDDVMGPYKDTGLAWPHWEEGKGHNVIGLRMHDGRYAMVCSAITYGEVFTSDNPDGPWELLGKLKVDPNGYERGLAILSSGGRERWSNVSLILRPDGRYMIVPRSTATLISDDGILGPYKIVHDRVYRKYPDLPQTKNEDPTVWYSGGMYHIVYNHWPTKTAYHFTSADGIHDWTYRGIAFKKDDMPFRYTDGTTNDWSFIERPMAFVEDGHVTHFTFSVLDVKKGQDRGNDNHGSKILVVPFDGKAFDRDMQRIVAKERKGG
ncbi:MAG: glycoside hydrolase family protein [Puniceicoccaceae bacterium]